MRPGLCQFFQRLVYVHGNGLIVFSLFHQCISLCIKYMLFAEVHV